MFKPRNKDLDGNLYDVMFQLCFERTLTLSDAHQKSIALHKNPTNEEGKREIFIFSALIVLMCLHCWPDSIVESGRSSI